jgi:hypothetical protein
MTLGRSLLWFIIGVVWVCAAFAIVYAAADEVQQPELRTWGTMKKSS